jgi:hypothetical protein
MELRTAFHNFNSRYFRFGKKKLKTLTAVKWHRFEGSEGHLMGEMVRSPVDGTYAIRINRHYKDRNEWRTGMLTLLHEMAHFKLAGKDTGRGICNSRMFNQEMKRLANAGALNGLW